MGKPFRSSGYRPLRKFRVIINGLYTAVITDFSVAYKVVLSVPVLALTFFFQKWLDVGLLVLALGCMLMAELFNSAIEMLCDFVEDREDHRIRGIKDIAAAAAGVSIFVWLILLIIEAIHVWRLAHGQMVLFH